MGAAGAITQTGDAVGPPAGQPLVAGGARDIQLDHDVGDGSTQLDHSSDEFGAAMNGQASISVGHETSEHSGVASAPTPSLGGLLVGSVFDAVNNAHGHYT